LEYVLNVLINVLSTLDRLELTCIAKVHFGVRFELKQKLQAKKETKVSLYDLVH
jgi:hypothetical protein